MKKALFSLLCVFYGLSASAQIHDPVHFTVEWRTVSETEAEIVFTGAIEEGWHVYSTDLSGAPVATTLVIEDSAGVELTGGLRPLGDEVNTFDEIFNADLRYFEDNVSFVQGLRLTSADYRVSGYLQYFVCNDENCLPPAEVSFDYGKNKPAAAS